MLHTRLEALRQLSDCARSCSPTGFTDELLLFASLIPPQFTSRQGPYYWIRAPTVSHRGRRRPCPPIVQCTAEFTISGTHSPTFETTFAGQEHSPDSDVEKAGGAGCWGPRKVSSCSLQRSCAPSVLRPPRQSGGRSPHTHACCHPPLAEEPPRHHRVTRIVVGSCNRYTYRPIQRKGGLPWSCIHTGLTASS